MSVHDWSSRWFHHHDESQADRAGVEADDAPAALAEALDRRDAEVTPLFSREGRGSGPAEATSAPTVSRPSQRELDPEPDTGLNQDLAALSRVILNLPVEPLVADLPAPEAIAPEVTEGPPSRPRGARVRLDAVPDEAPLVPTGVVGGARARRDPEVEQPPAAPASRAGARARRDVPPLVGAPVPGDAVVTRGKHAAGWADEPAEAAEAVEFPASHAAGADFDWPVIDSWPAIEEPEPAAAAEPVEWSAPAVPFELEPEPEVDVEPLRWSEALEVSTPDEAPQVEAYVEPVIDSADDVFRWTAAEMALPLEVPDLIAVAPEVEPEPKPEPVVQAKPEPEPTPVVSWDSMAVAPKVPAARPVQSSAALLRELSFLD